MITLERPKDFRIQTISLTTEGRYLEINVSLTHHWSSALCVWILLVFEAVPVADIVIAVVVVVVAVVGIGSPVGGCAPPMVIWEFATFDFGKFSLSNKNVPRRYGIRRIV